MGQSGVEPNDPHGAVNAMWENQADRMTKAKNHARIARNRKDYTSAHSIMLSAYITALGGVPAERHHPVKFFVLALWHAFCMFRHRHELNHNQLDVLVQFLLKLRSRLPFVTSGRPFSWYRWHSPLDRQLIRLAGWEVAKAQTAKMRGQAKPHQVALAFMTCAEVRYAAEFVFDGRENIVELDIRAALAMEAEIRAEEQPMGLRQFVRILRKAGELHLKPEMRRANTTSFAQAQLYLQRALDLARGEANAPDQVPKILPFVHF